MIEKQNFLLVSVGTSMNEPTIKVEDGASAFVETQAIEQLKQSSRYKPGMKVVEQKQYRAKIYALMSTFKTV